MHAHAETGACSVLITSSVPLRIILLAWEVLAFGVGRGKSYIGLLPSKRIYLFVSRVKGVYLYFQRYQLAFLFLRSCFLVLIDPTMHRL